MNYELGKLHEGVSIEDYNASPGLRSGDLHLLKQSPAHYKAARERPRKPTLAMEFGGLFHSAIENPAKFLSSYIEEPEFVGMTKGKDAKESKYSAEAKQKKSQWYSDLKPGTVVVKQEWKENLIGMLKAVTSHPLIGAMLKNSVREASGWVTDPETGLVLKFRPDFLAELGFIVDFKSTTDARPGHFVREIFSDRGNSQFYILSAAHYAHCARLMGLKRPDSFTFVAIEKEAPWGIMVYPMDIGCLGPGEQWRAELTKLYAKCSTADSWPCYPSEAHQTVPPEWCPVPGGDQ